MSRSQAFDAVQQLRQDLLGESAVDPGLLVRMKTQLDGLETRQKKLERNPMVALGRNLHWAGGAVVTVVGVVFGPLAMYWLKAKLHL